jgi:hypothetical protein
MTKKKKIDIANKLNALNPRVPTRTRIIKSDDTNNLRSKESVGSEKIIPVPFGTLYLFYENMSAMEKLGKSMIEDTKRFQGLFFESFTNKLSILYEIIHTNMNFTSEILRRIQDNDLSTGS